MPQRRSKKLHIHNLYQDIGLIVLSVLIAAILIQSGILTMMANQVGQVGIIGIFIAGLFFTSVFTTAPAIVVLTALSHTQPLWLVASLGAAGSLVGDYLLFLFIRDRFAEDMLSLLHRGQHRQIHQLVRRLPALRWILAGVGMLIIASPLPDELGIACLGLSKTRHSLFVAFSVIANFVGILAIGVVATHKI